MYVLYADDHQTLDEQAQLFQQHMEPLLQRCEAALRAGQIPPSISEIPQYLKVCRWPFRRLEYSFALDALATHLRPGQRFLDAGSGATPLAHAIAGLGVEAEACDGDSRLIGELRSLDTEQIYGTKVRYSAQDLTRTIYSDNTFDAIACISVLEHIPAPADKQALRELLRILKPGGLLVVTVDFTPKAKGVLDGRAGHLLQRTLDLARSGNFAGIIHGIRGKIDAQRAVQGGKARLPRSANQCFELEHLMWDLAIGPNATTVPSRLTFSTDLESVSAEQVRRFWDLEPDLFNNQGRRIVLPAAKIVQKLAPA